MNRIDIMNEHKLAKQTKTAQSINSELLPDTIDEVELPDLIEPVIYTPAGGKLIEQQDSLDDLKYSRETLQGLMGNGQTVLNELMQTAMLSGNPRAYEVVSQMIKTLTDAAKEIVNLQSKMLDIQIKTNIANNVPEAGQDPDTSFNGTTNDLLEQLERARAIAD